jgi:hypothetical protein
MDKNYKDHEFLMILAGVVMIGLVVISYALFQRRNESLPVDPYTQEIQQIGTQSESTDEGDIERDLQNTDFDSIDAELEAIEVELEASI